jgi:flagellar basal body-associated protein FliL
MINIICNINLKDEFKLVRELQEECDKKEKKILVLSIIILIGVFKLVSFFMSYILGTEEPEITKVISILGGLIVALVAFLFINMFNEEVHDRVNTRIKLLRMLPNIEILDINELNLTYISNSDQNKIIKEMYLKGFETKLSARVKEKTINIDDFLILLPYEG